MVDRIAELKAAISDFAANLEDFASEMGGDRASAILEAAGERLTQLETGPNYEAIHQGANLRCDHSGHKMWFDSPGSMGDLMGQGPGEFCEHCEGLRGFDRRKVAAALAAAVDTPKED